ncbi:MAG: molybdopterin-binding protein [Steroidobacteraceae bacterium]
MKKSGLGRRRWLKHALAAGGALALSGCDELADSPRVNAVLDSANGWTYTAQRLLLGRDALAQLYTEADISPHPRANGTSDPDTDAYNALVRGGFAAWRLQVGGLVEQPLSLSLDELQRMPSRSQITRHDCVEGWSYIAKWTGVPLSSVLHQARLKPAARYIAFMCADTLEVTLDGTGRYYETIDLRDARHPQTLLAYGMNDRPLPIPYGAPLRLRLARQLGYKMAKYIMRIDAVASFKDIERGKGGFWEDRGYQWYAGI